MRRLLGAAASACLGVSALPAQAQGPILEHGVAILQGLDKVTARVSPVRAPLDQPTQFGTLEVVVRACRETPPTEPPESAAFLEIRELPPASDAGECAGRSVRGLDVRIQPPPYRPWSTRSMTSGWSTARSPWPPPRSPGRAGDDGARIGIEHGRHRQGAAQLAVILLAGDLDRAELAQVVGHELRVQEAVAARLRRSTSATSATLLASRVRVNMLSPKKAAPSETPYSPPARRPPAQASTLCA